MDVAYDVIGSGPPVVLVAGLAQPGARWRRVADRLAKPLAADATTYTVVSVDNRETGRTGPSTDAFTLSDLAADVLTVMDRLGHTRFFLAGISMGGMIAQEILVAATARVRAAALLATHGGGQHVVAPPDPSVLMPSQPITDDASRWAAARELWSRLSGPGFAARHPDVIDEEARLSVDAATPLDGVLRQLQAIMQFDPGDAVVAAARRVPVTVIHGDHDPLVPYPNGQHLAGRLGVDLVTLAGAGHGLEFERADDVAGLLRHHFAGCG